MRQMVCVAVAAGFTLTALAGVARAAPQIIAAVPSNGPVQLVCDGAECAAEFSTICLQRSRFTPFAGTPYFIRQADRGAVAVTGVRRNGETLFLDPGLLRVASLRSQTAVRFVVPAETLEALGLARVSVTVHRLATLIPRPVAGDPQPQTADDIALAVKEIHGAGAYWAEINAEKMAVARLTNRVINGLPRNGSVSDDEGAALWEAAAALEAGLPEDVLEMTHGLVDHCRETGSFTGSFSMRYCLGIIHDQYMRSLNFEYWKAIRPTS